MVGTIQRKRKYLPKDEDKDDILFFQKKHRRQRGHYEMSVSGDGELAVAVWQDTAPVTVIASHGSIEEKTVTRKIRGKSFEVACPASIVAYNTYMGGVDLADQLRLGRWSFEMAYGCVHLFYLFFSQLLFFLFVHHLVGWLAG